MMNNLNLGKESQKIMIVDDNAICSMVLSYYLNKKGYEVEEVSNGEQCIEKVINNMKGYLAILMDINLPGMDGITVTKKIKEQGYEGTIIGIGGNSEDENPSIESGMNHFLVKPQDNNKLFELIQCKK